MTIQGANRVAAMSVKKLILSLSMLLLVLLFPFV